jgi:DNA-binding SARP family transcriptional activator/predicted ATPase
VQPLRIALLGGFELHTGSGEPISLPSRNAKALLAYLAMSNGRAQARDKLATVVWGGKGSEQARASLRQTLSQLRRVLNPVSADILKVDGDAILVEPSAAVVDAVRLQELVRIGTSQALEESSGLYHGALLEGIGPFPDTFETWLMAERTRLQQLMEQGLKMLLGTYQRENAIDASIRTALRLLSLDALQEPLHRQLMRLYAAQGRPGSALKQYELCRGLLQRELGVAPELETQQLAERIRLDHRENCTVGVPLPPASPAEGRAMSPVAERRFTTLLVCALADASALAARLDAEELRTITAAFEDCCERVISRHGGLVYDFPGDVVTACFCYPQADEHDAERAVRAGLEIVAAVDGITLSSPQRLRVRVSIASGEVVVSRPAHENGDSHPTIAGRATYLAAGVAAVAAPGSVVIAESTRRLLGELFECCDLPPQALDGFGEPVQVWRVLRARSGQGRFEATRGSTPLTRLVGREEELELLLRRWERARTGNGQVVILAGEPGIGKSRLIKALRDALVDEPLLYFGYYCSPHHQQSAFYPVVQQLRRAAGYEHDDPPEIQLNRLESLLRLSTDVQPEDIVLAADLLSIPTGGRYPSLELAPQLQKEKTQRLLGAQLVGLTRRLPALMAFDDIHWSDSSTREFLERIVDLVQALPVLVIVTHRPGTAMSHAGESHVTSLVLKRLRRRESEVLVRAVTGGGELPAGLLSQIVERADGVPLFLEELAKNVLEAGVLDDAAERQLTGGASAAKYVPHTLSDLLLARLDRLGSARIVAQEAAVIGRRFSYPLLAASSSVGEPELLDALAKLSDAELVYVQGTPPHSRYFFKHALVQDAAYASILRNRRAALHGRVAQAIEAELPEQAELEPEVVAQHFAAAGDNEKALLYWTRAAELAARRWAYRDAVAYIDNALEMLATLPESRERSERELGLRVMLGQTWILASGYTLPQVEAAFDRARELCDELGDSHQLFFVLLGLWQLYLAREEIPRAKLLAERLSALAVDECDQGLAIEASTANVVTLFTCGQFGEALARAQEAMALERSGEQRGHILSAGYDGRVISATGAAWSLWVLGYPDQALASMQEALEMAERLGHPYTQAMSLHCAAFLRVFRREAHAAIEYAERGISLSRKHGFAWSEAFALVLRGWAQSQLALADDGIREMREALAGLERVGHVLYQPNLLDKLAGACSAAGQFEEALTVTRRALDIAVRTGEQDHVAELHRRMGELLLQRSGSTAEAEAERCFHRALEVARSQGARSWELRAATSVARLWRRQGRCGQASQLLQPIYDRFQEGFDTPDLQDARLLLESLRRAGC